MLSGCDLYLHLPPFQFLSTSFELWLNPSAKMAVIKPKNIKKNLQVLFQFFWDQEKKYGFWYERQNADDGSGQEKFMTLTSC